MFVLSHMRSRSSLLCHLLGSHPEISGYTESHIKYGGRTAFLQLRSHVSDALDGATLSRYVLDKVLHDWYVYPPLLKQMHVIPIYLIRAPEESLKSLRHIMKDEDDFEALRRSMKHYCDRLRWMAQCCPQLDRPAVLIESNALIESTDAVFRLLEDVLGLSSSLEEAYEVFRYTGRPVYGDPSKNITSGTIIRSEQSSYQHEVRIPLDMLEEAKQEYDRCREVLSRHCRHLHEATECTGANPQVGPACVT